MKLEWIKLNEWFFTFTPNCLLNSHLKKVMLESIINVLSWLIPQIRRNFLNTAGVLFTFVSTLIVSDFGVSDPL